MQVSTEGLLMPLSLAEGARRCQRRKLVRRCFSDQEWQGGSAAPNNPEVLVVSLLRVCPQLPPTKPLAVGLPTGTAILIRSV